MLARYRGRPLGSIGHLAALSASTRPRTSSAARAARCCVNDDRLVERAEIIREKGTNRSQFFRGQVDKYTWVDIGSSYLPSEIVAAFLWAQMEEADASRAAARDLGALPRGVRRARAQRTACAGPIVPPDCEHNAHMYYLLLPDLATRTQFIPPLGQQGIQATFHYVPLHLADGPTLRPHVGRAADHHLGWRPTRAAAAVAGPRDVPGPRRP